MAAPYEMLAKKLAKKIAKKKGRLNEQAAQV
jgi:hypothetical protein